jgi:hypothetical protein
MIHSRPGAEKRSRIPVETAPCADLCGETQSDGGNDCQRKRFTSQVGA